MFLYESTKMAYLVIFGRFLGIGLFSLTGEVWMLLVMVLILTPLPELLIMPVMALFKKQQW